MAATHCAYSVMKMPSMYGVLSIRCDLKDAAGCVGKVVKATAAADSGDKDVAGSEGSLPGDRPAAKKARATPQELAGRGAGSSSCPGKGGSQRMRVEKPCLLGIPRPCLYIEWKWAPSLVAHPPCESNSHCQPNSSSGPTRPNTCSRS